MNQEQGRLIRFRKAKEAELARLRATPMPKPFIGGRPSMSRALMTGQGDIPAVMAEYKRASPSRGVICESVSVEDAVLAYARSGAGALSILTEEQYFLGNIDYLFRARKALDDSSKNALPLLRKDFLFDPLQIEATAATPASAFLLIVRQTPDSGELRSWRELGEKYGLEAVVEVFDLEDLELARKSGAHIIQVNARDLETFAVDRKACLELVREAGQRSGEIWIAASGMECHEHLVAARDAGFHAALVGTALMQDGALEQNLRSLLQSEAATR